VVSKIPVDLEDVVSSSETLVPTYKIRWWQRPEDCGLNNSALKTLKCASERFTSGIILLHREADRLYAEGNNAWRYTLWFFRY